jgi:signal transduction histidine kinase
VEEAVQLLSPTLRKQGIQLDMMLSPGLPPCNSDPHMVEQVILNLISNALEAMEKMDTGKKIGIVTGCDRTTVYVSISDAGPGVPLSIRDKIFDPFYTTKPNSSGIGLSICHRIMTDHKALLEVDSSEYGGAKFIARFPLKAGQCKQVA